VIDYKSAGVDIEEGYRAVNKYKEYASSTMNKAVLNGLGSFAGMYSLSEFFSGGMKEPVLISGTDGIGTKLDLALKMNKLDTVGIDCVAMCVNDILCQGAKPLFFLDYIACGKLNADITSELVKGAALGCRETGMVLLGGETAEHPGVVPDDSYDMAGFAIGIADRQKIVDGSKITEGDLLLGIASSGVHSNGFSLIRKVITDFNEDFGGMPIGYALLEPTRLYVKPILQLMNDIKIKGMAHITGGGFYENVPRMLKKDSQLLCEVNVSWEIPAIFNRIAYGIKSYSQKDSEKLKGAEAQKKGEEILATDMEIRKTMFNTYNMGMAFILALSPEDLPHAASLLENCGFPCMQIGKIIKAPNGITPGDIKFA